MTQKQIIIAMLIINSITIGSSMTMQQQQRQHMVVRSSYRDGYRYKYSPESMYTPNQETCYFYPNHTNRTNLKAYDHDFKVALVKNLDALKDEGASKEDLKTYATNGMNILEENKEKIINSQTNK